MLLQCKMSLCVYFSSSTAVMSHANHVFNSKYACTYGWNVFNNVWVLYLVITINKQECNSFFEWKRKQAGSEHGTDRRQKQGSKMACSLDECANTCE